MNGHAISKRIFVMYSLEHALGVLKICPSTRKIYNQSNARWIWKPYQFLYQWKIAWNILKMRSYSIYSAKYAVYCSQTYMIMKLGLICNEKRVFSRTQIDLFKTPLERVDFKDSLFKKMYNLIASKYLYYLVDLWNVIKICNL